MINKDRIAWIDYTKAFACLLVVTGHLLMSLRLIDNYSTITEFIIWFIYLFHMPLFMCMSGMLYHMRTHIKSFNDYKKFEFKKIINLLVPYVTFYSITMILNILFSNNVNTPKGINEWLGIFNKPIAPYWFLYALLSIFIIVPILEKLCRNNKKIVMAIFIIFKIISIFYIPNIYFIKSVMTQGLYFYIGAFINSKLNNSKKKKYIVLVLLSIAYITFSIIFYLLNNKISDNYVEFINILFAIIGLLIIIEIFKNIKNSKILNSFKKYTFQIFLMHTIFAAGIRIIMFIIGIDNYFVHLVIGLASSIYIPVLVSIISSKLKYTNFFFYPLKTIEECKKG